jgi:glycogen operon protein
VASINFVTAHDGFTLRDLVSYNQKHNEANGEGNADGESHNRSWNCGAEGDTENPVVLKLRAKQQRNLLASLLLAQGVPMVLMGDELGRTQRGNNNAYCQDNEISWESWSGIDGALLDFTRWLIDFRRGHSIFRRRRWFQGRPIRGAIDIVWFKPDGKPMSDQDWVSRHARSLGVFLNGKAIPGRDYRGQPIVDDSFLLLFNGQARPVYWNLPKDLGEGWRLVLDTDRLQPEGEPAEVPERVLTRARSIVVLQA